MTEPQNRHFQRDFILSLLLVIAVMIMIFSFSHQEGPKSDETSGRLVNILVHVIQDFSNQSDPRQEQMLVGRATFFIRKSAHIAEFALLGLALMLHVTVLQSRFYIRFPKLLSILIGVLYAWSDELHQLFIPGRSPNPTDVAIDSAGVMIGVLIMWAFFVLRRKKEK